VTYTAYLKTSLCSALEELSAEGKRYNATNDRAIAIQTEVDRIQLESESVHAFLTHSEAFLQSQPSDFIHGVIAEGRIKLSQLRESLEAHAQQAQEVRETLEESKSRKTQLKRVGDEFARASGLLIKSLTDPLQELGDMLHACGWDEEEGAVDSSLER